LTIMLLESWIQQGSKACRDAASGG